MRTLLISLACMMLVGCAATTPRGMENIGSVDGYVYASGNQTQKAEIEKRNTEEVASAAGEAAYGVVDYLVTKSVWR